jgi:3-hydroxyacyl-CoA dehydrogenase
MSNMNDESRSAPALANAVPRAIGRVGIIGAGRAGTGIAIELLDADVPVTLFDFAGEEIKQGMALARSAYQDAVAQGALAPEKFDRRMALLAGTVYLHHLKDCDLIIDAACTDMAGRENLFRRLDQIAKPGAILMTHAAHGAHVDIDRVAGCTRRAGEVLGWHVPDPANASASMEFVCGKETSAQALASVIALAALSRAAPVAS